MPHLAKGLWELTGGVPHVDPGDLAHAVEAQAVESGLDYRTRLLIRAELDRQTLAQRLRDTTATMLASEGLRKRAAQNWYILFGEQLPS